MWKKRSNSRYERKQSALLDQKGGSVRRSANGWAREREMIGHEIEKVGTREGEKKGVFHKRN